MITDKLLFRNGPWLTVIDVKHISLCFCHKHSIGSIQQGFDQYAIYDYKFA